MRIKKKVVLIIMISICLLFLSGCLDIERSLEITPIGMLKYHSEHTIAESAIASAGYDKLDDFYKNIIGDYKGVLRVRKTQQIRSGEMWYGYNLDGYLTRKNIDGEISRLFSKNLSVTFERKGFFVTEVTLTIHRSKRDKDYFEGMEELVENDRFTIKVPYKIVETNGLKDINNPRCATWDISEMEFGNKKTQTMMVKYINVTNILLCIIGAALSVFILTRIIKGIKNYADNHKTVSIGLAAPKEKEETDSLDDFLGKEEQSL